ncbi:hypothetical protein [Actinomadura sp. HBU206391]|uniref:hypothetical protein n=1 Tax=Actinomadura sp. HBU206391 TaxID=2731692 RepID=UPI00164F5EBD|nr:hypothetical protein [Actinomadura sp. HBU206391]MBC6458215.1 hypothetical protein [Actinomadura sp. HBU206391]
METEQRTYVRRQSRGHNGDVGEGAISYIAAVLLVAVIAGAISVSGIGRSVEAGIVAAVCRVGQQDCATGKPQQPKRKLPEKPWPKLTPRVSPAPSPTWETQPGKPGQKADPTPLPVTPSPKAPPPLTPLQQGQRVAKLGVNYVECSLVFVNTKCIGTWAWYYKRTKAEERARAARKWAEDHDIALTVGTPSGYDPTLRIYTLDRNGNGSQNVDEFIKKMEELQKNGE